MLYKNIIPAYYTQVGKIRFL